MTRIDDDQDPSTPLVWLWDAGRWCGVAGNEPQATEAAEAHIAASGTATVEMARLVSDGMQTVYERTGVGVTGTPADSLVSWSPLKRAA